MVQTVRSSEGGGQSRLPIAIFNSVEYIPIKGVKGIEGAGKSSSTSLDGEPLYSAFRL
jgi:hypothetical protein